MSAERHTPSALPLHWSLYWLLWTSGVIAAGTLLGVLLFPLVGKLIGARFTVGELAITGAKTLGFYFALWAPGLAIVLTVKRAYEQRRRKVAK
ncbi:MAG TPA: hypothetical protein VGD81_04960 [Opitutaceae bacterium]